MATAAALAGLTLAGCSSGTVIGPPPGAEGNKTANAILSDGLALMRTAKTAHLKGSIAGLFFDADVGGGSFTGTVNSGGKVFNIVYIAGPGGDESKAKIYIKASAAVWAAASSAALGTCVGNQWLMLDPASAGAGASGPQGADQLTADAGQLGNLASFADFLANNEGTLSKGARGATNGTNAIAITNDSGAAFLVAIDGPPYIARISFTSTGTPQSLDFTSWNRPVTFRSPSGARSLTTVLAGCPGAANPSPSPTETPSPSP